MVPVNVSDYAAEVLTWLQKLERKTVVQALRPPIDRTRLESDLARLQLRPCEDLLAFYLWAGGTAAPTDGSLDDLHFFPGFYWLSWEDAVRNFLTFRADARWRPGWFPVFANGGGDFYVVDCGERGGSRCGVIGFLLGEREQLLEYESLTTMLATILDCYRTGCFFVDGRGYLEMVDASLAKIAKIHNPLVPLWQSAGRSQ